MSELKVGDKLYTVYRNYGASRPREYYIVGETRVSWIISEREGVTPDHWGVSKIKKKGDHVDGGRSWNYFSSTELRDEAVWAEENRRYIAGWVEGQTPAVLRQIAVLTGYKEKEPTKA